MNIGFYYGSFDPFTNGHFNLVSEAAKRFDKVIVTIGSNPLKMYKRRRFNKKIMKKQMEKLFIRENLINVEVSFGFFSTMCKLKNYRPTLIRGIRNSKDESYERKIAKILKMIFRLETIFIRGGNISSTMVMNKIREGENVEHLLPKEIFEIVKTK